MKAYYVYFIQPEPESQFVTFGETTNLGNRWQKYRTMQPNPQLLGLIECKDQDAMNALEFDIKCQHLKASIYRNEWLYHTEEVRAFYLKNSNVDIEKALADAIETEKERNQKYHQRPEVKARKRDRKAYMQEYHQRSDVKARERERGQTPERKAYMKEYDQRPERKQRKRKYDRIRDKNPERKARKNELRRRKAHPPSVP